MFPLTASQGVITEGGARSTTEKSLNKGFIMNFFKALALATYLLGWFQRASQDGVISQEELTEAITGAITQLDLGLNIHLPMDKG